MLIRVGVFFIHMDLKDYEDVGFAYYAIPSFNRFAWAVRDDCGPTDFFTIFYFCFVFLLYLCSRKAKVAF